MSTFIYHFTHHSHLAAIAQAGLVCKAKVKPGSYTDISSATVQDNRAKKQVPIDPPNGNLHDYVPFYFGPRSPTLFTINQNPHDHGGVQQSELIYLVTSVEAVEKSGLKFVFTDGHGVVEITDYFDDLSDLNQIDWNIINGKYWHDHPEYGLDRKRRRQAEFLVHQSCPWQQIIGIGVFDEAMKQTVENVLASLTYKPKVAVKRDWYY